MQRGTKKFGAMFMMSDLQMSPVTLTPLPRRPLTECSFIVQPMAAGPPIGSYRGQEFAGLVRDAFGRLFVFSGIASRQSDGRLIADNLRPGEFLTISGLIYSLAADALDADQDLSARWYF